jgi:SAM-dependent methyltransferase
MNQGLLMQFQRLEDLHSFVYEGNNNEGFLNERKSRSPSSLEEELVSNLPLFDEVEEQEITHEASNILGGKTLITDPGDFELIMSKNPELGKKVKAIGLKNNQHMVQANFYEKVREILDLSKSYEFPAEYELITPVDFMGINATCLEQFNYGGSYGYRSMLYHLMRHLNNITGEESKSDIDRKIKDTFSGKRVLELGSGPGFFLYVLRELGADVTGIDKNETFRIQTEQAKLNILYGDAKELERLVGDKRFDIVLSKDFLSFGVTRYDAKPIMIGVHSVLRENGFTVHQIEYKKTSEERYLSMVEKFCKSQGNDFEIMRNLFSRLNDEQKEYLLRRNILNISSEHLEELGFKPFTSYRLDVDEFLTISLGKSKN